MMMALKSPSFMPSPTGPSSLISSFSPYTDSPNSPAPFPPQFHSNRSSGPSDTLHPPPSPYPQYVDPSPVSSNGTESTEIEDDAQEHDENPEEPVSASRSPEDMEISSPSSQEMLSRLDTSVQRARSDSDDAPQSVIHAPTGFKAFEKNQTPPPQDRSTPSPTERSEHTVTSPKTPEQIKGEEPERRASVTVPINTSIPPPKTADRGTPRAQTRAEAEEESKRRARATPGLEDIPESADLDKLGAGIAAFPTGLDLTQSETVAQTARTLDNAVQEIGALKSALSECWTLCNTLAGLSSIHRERIFNFSGKTEVQEQAWRSCWKLCQKLYESRDEDNASQVRPTLEMCREFCQALFEARQRQDEASDSVLRVSFELNNHLYNTHDRSLPEAFRERTLDFYITLCHRLMKQRTSLPEETDALLRACWSLAEMLFNIRQNNRDGKPADEELLGSAVQACWELCDLFREGWTQVRPDRGTPRPSQATFSQSSASSTPAASERSSSVDDSYRTAKSFPPETPTTVFDDTVSSPDEERNVPNILVLGPDNNRTQHRWSSGASSFSDSSQRTSSTTKTATTAGDDLNLMRLKILILKAAQNAGYPRTLSMQGGNLAAGGNPLAASQAVGQPSLSPTLPSFVKTLSTNSFGSQAWQISLLGNYKKLVLADPTLRAPASLLGRRVAAPDMARAVQWMARSGQYLWFRDLYRLVFGFHLEDAPARATASIAT